VVVAAEVVEGLMVFDGAVVGAAVSTDVDAEPAAPQAVAARPARMHRDAIGIRFIMSPLNS
jgi:hypothetical protein